VQILAVANRYPPWSRGGYEVIAASAVAALRAAGHRVSILTTAPDPSDREANRAPLTDVHRDLRWYWHDHEFPPISLRAAAALERQNARTMRRWLRELGPDIVLWWGMGGMSLSLLEQVRRAGVPTVGVVADDWMTYAAEVDAWTKRWRHRLRPLAPIAERVVGVPARVNLASAAMWVFISEHLRSRARVPSEYATVAHPGVDPARFASRPPGEWGWRLLYCGRIDPRKGIARAVESLAQLPAEARLTIDGGGNDKHAAELSALAQRLGVGERVELSFSAPEDVPRAYVAADAVVFPIEWEEPWGLVPLEAMAVGRPVVASRAGGGADEYLRDGENCLRFDAGDADALAAAVRRLAGDPALRARLVAGGRETAAGLTERRFNDAIEEELERAVTGGVRSI
jgi:glycosyltransferase involved in cell wall biosynthesis